MKKLFLLYILILSFSARSQNTNSVLRNGEWYKIAISKTGVYKIDATFLKKIGISINNINPKKIRIYGNGGQMLPEKISDFRYNSLQENAIFIEGESDNQFNQNDYILFYGKGPHQWNTENHSSISHIQNIYSDKAYYFINIGNNLNGKRIGKKNEITGSSSNTFNTYNDYIFYEKENINLISLGRLWFGEDFNIESNKTIDIPFKNHITGSEVTIKLAAVAQSSRISFLNMRVNNQDIANLQLNAVTGSSTLAKHNAISKNITSKEDFKIQLSYNNNGNPSAKAFLDYIEIIGEKKLIADGTQFNFRNFEVKNLSGIVTYEIGNKKNISEVWDVTDAINPKKIKSLNQNNNFSFKSNAGTVEEYVVLNNKSLYTPEALDNSSVTNQNLRSLKNIDYLVITNNNLKSEAQRLTNHHKKNSDFSTKIVEVDKIYNEFSSGSPDIVAIRDFIKHLNDNSTTKKLKYVCFFGDSSYDFKNRINKNNNIVPSYHGKESFNLSNSYVTDDFFVMIDDTDGDMSDTSNTIDITSGRIPVTTKIEAKQVVDKILNYYSSKTFGDWRNRITLVADDIDSNTDITLQEGIEEVADIIKSNKPEFNINKIYADAYKQITSSGGERYPQVKDAITNTMQRGCLVFNYFGHGNEDGWAEERILDMPQIQSFNNKNKLPLFITVTCEFSRFDNPLRHTAGEKLFKNPNGGATSMITTTRAIYISFGGVFNKKLTKYVLDFNGDNKSIAENLILAKNETNNLQKYFIYYFGDPAMKLAIPKPNILLTKVNNVDINNVTEPLKALSKVKLEGIITDKNNILINNFNGIASTSIFDKPIDKKTLDNDNHNIIKTFDTQTSKIFTGKSSVKNGKFSFEFIVPKDIKIALGKGKISMYAENKFSDKTGANFDISIGGINENAPKDTKGPNINGFMDDKSFTEGADTTPSPNLIIELEDSSGINTSITAVDHDIVAILDGNEATPIILNDYYETELDNFTKGTVNYKFQNLKPGKHTLKIKAWDTYNNSSEKTFSFNVISNSILKIDKVLNYPNPLINYTEFWFKHNKPNEPLNTQIQIFTISGKLIKTISKQVITNGTLSRSIQWNGLDDFGNKLGKGVYVYKLKVTTENNLTFEKYEKLVIL